MNEIPALRTYVSGVIVASLLSGAVASGWGGTSGDVVLLAVLVAGGALAERFKVSLFGDSHVSLGVVVCMLAAILGGARDAVVVSVLVGLTVNLGGVVALHKAAFNLAAYVLSTLAFVMVFGALTSFGDMGSFPRAIAPATLAALADLAVNSALVGGAVALATKRGFADVVREKYAWLSAHYLPLGALAVSAAAGYEAAGPLALLLFGVAMIGPQIAIAQFARARVLYATRVRDIEERLRSIEAELRRLDEVSGPRHVA